MSNKPTRPISLSPKMTNEQMKELTRKSEEERKQKALSYLANQRSTIAVNVLCNLVREKDCDKEDYLQMVDLSVEMADRMMDRLYSSEEK